MYAAHADVGLDFGGDGSPDPDAMPSQVGNESNKWKPLERMGEGTYGVVYKAQSADGQMVALKKIRITDVEEGISTTTVREIALLQTLNHRNVVKLLDVVWQDHKVYIVFELVDQDLKVLLDHRIKDHLRMTPDEVWGITGQLLQGLAYCHSRGVMHRDIKPQNILIGDNCSVVRLCDFGLARSFNCPMRAYTHQVVTLWYRAPEILLGIDVYLPVIDVWAVGCIMAELCNMRPLTDGDSEIDQLFKIFRVTGTPTESTWPGISALRDFQSVFPLWRPADLAGIIKPLDGEAPSMRAHALDLLRSLLALDPGQRSQAKRALRHPYFNYGARLWHPASFPDAQRARGEAGTVSFARAAAGMEFLMTPEGYGQRQRVAGLVLQKGPASLAVRWRSPFPVGLPPEQEITQDYWDTDGRPTMHGACLTGDKRLSASHGWLTREEFQRVFGFEQDGSGMAAWEREWHAQSTSPRHCQAAAAQMSRSSELSI